MDTICLTKDGIDIISIENCAEAYGCSTDEQEPSSSSSMESSDQQLNQMFLATLKNILLEESEEELRHKSTSPQVSIKGSCREYVRKARQVVTTFELQAYNSYRPRVELKYVLRHVDADGRMRDFSVTDKGVLNGTQFKYSQVIRSYKHQMLRVAIKVIDEKLEDLRRLLNDSGTASQFGVRIMDACVGNNAGHPHALAVLLTFKDLLYRELNNCDSCRQD